MKLVARARRRSASSTSTASCTRSRTAARTTTGRSSRATGSPRKASSSARATARASTSAPGGRHAPRVQPVETFPVAWRTAWSREGDEGLQLGARAVPGLRQRLTRLAPRLSAGSDGRIAACPVQGLRARPSRRQLTDTYSPERAARRVSAEAKSQSLAASLEERGAATAERAHPPRGRAAVYLFNRTSGPGDARSSWFPDVRQFGSDCQAIVSGLTDRSGHPPVATPVGVDARPSSRRSPTSEPSPCRAHAAASLAVSPDGLWLDASARRRCRASVGRPHADDPPWAYGMRSSSACTARPRARWSGRRAVVGEVVAARHARGFCGSARARRARTPCWSASSARMPRSARPASRASCARARSPRPRAGSCSRSSPRRTTAGCSRSAGRAATRRSGSPRASATSAAGSSRSRHDPAKCEAWRRNVADADLEEWAELEEGDAFETLPASRSLRRRLHRRREGRLRGAVRARAREGRAGRRDRRRQRPLPRGDARRVLGGPQADTTLAQRHGPARPRLRAHVVLR